MKSYRARRLTRERIAASLREVLEREPTRSELQAAVAHELHERIEGDDEHRLAPARGRPQSAAGRAAETTALAGLEFELKAAEHAGEVFDVLLSNAKAGDVSCAIFLASRVAPAARQRATVRVDALADHDLNSAAGCEAAITSTIQAVAAGGIDIAAGEALIGMIRHRLAAAETSAKASAYQLAVERLSTGHGGGLPPEIVELRRAFSAQPDHETETER